MFWGELSQRGSSMRGVMGGLFGRTVGCALSFCLVTGPVFASAPQRAFAEEPSAVPIVESTSTVPAAAEASPTVVREDLTRRTENSNHFLLSDGSYRAEIHAGDINYRDDGGDLVPIDTSLVPGEEMGEWQTAAASVVASFESQSATDRPVAISGEDWTVSLDMLGVAEGAKLVYGSRARYLGVATDTDLEYESLPEGIKETLVLQSPAAPSTFRFFMATEGLQVAKSFDGSYSLYKPGTARPALTLGALSVVDSSQDIAGEPAVCSQATMTVEAAPGGALVTYELPEAWVSEPSRVFPIKVDPTLYAPDDTFVSSAYPTTNYGSSTELKCGYYDASTGYNRSLVKFNMSSVPAGAYVRGATYKAYQFHQYYTNTSTDTYLGKMSKSWTEGSTWSSLGAAVNNWTGFATYLGTATTTTRAQWVTWNVKSTAQEWVNNASTNLGLIHYQSEYGNQNTTHWRKFYSEDAGSTYDPQLVLEYESPYVDIEDAASIYKLGDQVTATMKVRTNYPTEVREARMLVNQADGDANRYRGYLGWFSYTPLPSGWQPLKTLADGSVLASYGGPTFGTDHITIDENACSVATVAGSPGYKRITFKFELNDTGTTYGDIQNNDLDTYFQMGTPAAYTWVSGWEHNDTNIDVLPKPVGTASVSKSASEWFREVDRNGDGASDTPGDLPDLGRGQVQLSWAPSEIADGYIIKLYDGVVHQQVGKVYGSSTTTWSTEGLGIYPSDSRIAGYGAANSYTGNPFTSAAAPRAMTREATLTVDGLTGAGVVVTDGTHLFTRRWGGSTYGGATAWHKIGTGLHDTTAGEDYGVVGPDFAGKDIRSAFMLDGYIYNGYVDMVAGSASVTGVWKSAEASDTATRKLTLSQPPLDRSTGAPVTASTMEVALTADSENIYSMSYLSGSGYSGWKVRVYDRDGTFVTDHTVATASYYTDGFISDGSALYFIEWGGSNRVTKVRLSDFKVANQWSITDQPTTQEINGCYDPANNVFWLGNLGYSADPESQATIYKHSGLGLDLRDDPNALYLKMANGTFDARHDYEFRVVPFNDAGTTAVLDNGAVSTTLDNRTVRVDDDPRHTEHSLGEMAGNSAQAGIDTGSFELDATDLSIKSWGPAAAVSRHYDSSVGDSLGLSPGWRFGFDQTLVETVAGQCAVYTDESGEEHTFRYSSAAGRWIAPNGFWGALEKHEPLWLDDTWTLELKDHTVLTFAEPSGELLSEVDRNGNEVTYSRSGGDLTIEAANGQSIVVDYENGSVVSATHRGAANDQLSQVAYEVTGAQLVVTRAAEDPELVFDTAYSYAGGRVTSIAVPSVGTTWSVEYAGDGTLSAVENSETATSMRREIVRNTASREATVSTFDGVTTYDYNPTGTCAVRSNEGSAGALTTMEYDAANLPTREVSPTGRETKRTYDSKGDVTFEWDEAGRMSSFVYNAAGDLTRTTDGGGSTTYRTYDARGNVLTEDKTLTKSGERSHTSYEYEDAGSHKGRLVSQISSIDATHSAHTDYASFDTVTGEAESVSDLGVQLSSAGTAQTLTRTSDHDERGNLVSETDALGINTATNVYDALGRITESTDASGVVTHSRYDALGNTVETWRSHESTSAKLDWRQMSYNGASLLVTETVKDKDGDTVSTVTHTYDELGREIKANDSLVPGAASTTYDSQGNATVATAEGGSTQTSGSTRTTFNAEGEEVATLEPGATTAATVTSYTVDGQVATQSNPDGSAAQTTYDAAGNVAAEAAPSGVGTATTTYQNDLDGRATSSKAPDGSVTTYSYDLLGQQTSAQIAGQNVSRTEYNSLGWVLKETDFDGTVKTKRYDKTGRMVKETISGLETSHVFDGCGREIGKTNPDGSGYTYEFDAFGRPVREIQTGTDGQVAKDTRTTFDAAGRVASMSESVAELARAYTYGSAGAVTIATTRGSHTTASTLDGTGQLRSVASVLDGVSLDLSVTATDTAGRVIGWQSSALGKQWTLSYDQAGRPYRQQSIAPRPPATSGVIALGLPPDNEGLSPYIYSPTTGKKIHDDFGFSYLDRSEDTTYTYGATNRLTSATRNGAATTYAYNATTGALAAYRRSGESTKALLYDEDGRITRAASTYYQHDSLGRRITQAPTTDFEKDPARVMYSWSGERLITQTGPNWSTEHVYDATGQRTRSVVTSGSTEITTTWAYEGIRLTGLDAVRSDTATWSLEYLYDEKGTITGGIYSAEDTSCAFLVVATDRGDVRELLDANGDAFAFYSYDAYGNPDETLSRQTGAVPAGLAADIAKRNVLRYAGYCYDEVSGLYYLSQRYYDPASACFISKDPARADGEESPYQYCAGDPIGKVDPSGEWAWVTFLRHYLTNAEKNKLNSRSSRVSAVNHFVATLAMTIGGAPGVVLGSVSWGVSTAQMAFPAFTYRRNDLISFQRSDYFFDAASDGMCHWSKSHWFYLRARVVSNGYVHHVMIKKHKAGANVTRRSTGKRVRGDIKIPSGGIVYR